LVDEGDGKKMNQKDFFPPMAVIGLSKSFGKKKAVDSISFSIGYGEFVALLGQNGAGKTTLFQMLSGLYPADDGSASVFGIDIGTDPVAAMSHIGIVFQQPALDLDLSVRANLCFQSRLHGVAPKEADQRIAYWLQRFSLTDRANDKARNLSGGNRRKVELARALLTQPQILLMDEATVGLDLASREQILMDVMALCREQGIGVLWATHLVEETKAADRILVLEKGRIKFHGTPQELMDAANRQDLAGAFLQLTQ
jgi:ABC-2 type transport system ATP-binding protein